MSELTNLKYGPSQSVSGRGELFEDEIRVLDLFSGIGGFSYGLKNAGGFKTVAYCEIEEFAQKLLLARMEGGELDSAPIHTDITKLDGRPLRGHVDLICGGFPCQDVSVAGKREGIDGERSGLWGEYARLIRQIRPRFVIVENVPGLLVYPGMHRVLGDLASSGYDAEWSCISAEEMGAPHKRDRVWIIGELADSESDGSERILRNLEVPNGIENRSEIEGKIQAGQSRRCCTTSEETEGDGTRTPFGGSKNVADSDRNNQRAGKRSEQSQGHTSGERPRDRCKYVSDSDNFREQQPEGNLPEKRGRFGFSSKKEVADSASEGLQVGEKSKLRKPLSEIERGSDEVANSASFRMERGRSNRVEEPHPSPGKGLSRCNGSGSSPGNWSSECRLGRTSDGISDGVDPYHQCLGWECGVSRLVPKGKQKYRADRLKGLGNAIVPSIAEFLGHRIMMKFSPPV